MALTPQIEVRDTVQSWLTKTNLIISNMGDGSQSVSTPNSLVLSDSNGKIDEQWIPSILAGDKTFQGNIEVSGTLTTDLIGNANTASQLETPRTISISGDATGSTLFDGSQNADIVLAVNSSQAQDSLSTARTISISGDATGSTLFDGTSNVDIALTVDPLGHNHDDRYYTETESDSLFVHLTGQETVTGDKTFSNNIVINGDLTVSGTTTTVDSTNTEISDNTILLNSGESGSNVSLGTSGFEVDRGTGTNARFVFDDADDEFKVDRGTGTLVKVLDLNDNVDAQTLQGDSLLDLQTYADSAVSTHDSDPNAHGDTFVKNQTNVVQVNQATDFLKAAADLGDVWDLNPNTTFVINTHIDLGGKRLDASGGPVSLLGRSASTTSLSSTGMVAGTYLITSNDSLQIDLLQINSPRPYNLDQSATAGTTILAWHGVRIVNAEDSYIQGYDNFSQIQVGFFNSYGFVFDLSFGYVQFNTCIFDILSSVGVSFTSTFTVTKRILFNSCGIEAASGATGIDMPLAVQLQPQQYILRGNSFTGAGVPITGYDYTNVESDFDLNRGIPNSDQVGQYYMNSNATATTIGTAGTFYKIQGTTTASPDNIQLSHPQDNRLEYLGVTPRQFKVDVVLTLTTANNKEVSQRIYRGGPNVTDGTLIASQQRRETTGGYSPLPIQAITKLNQGDWIEIWIQNDTDTTDITIVDMNTIVQQVT